MTTVEDQRNAAEIADGAPPMYDPFDYRVHEDPYPTFTWMRANAPLYRNEARDFWALTRYDDVEFALRHPRQFSSRNGISLEYELWGPHAVKTSLFLAMDPPDHGDYRRLTTSVFTLRRVAAMEPRIRELARARLAPLRDLDSFDFAADYAAALPNDVMCELAGIPFEDWDQIRADTDQLNQRLDGSEDRGTSSVAAALRLANYFADLVSALRRRPGDDLTSDMIRAEVHGARLSDSEVVAFLFLVISAGNESTGKTISNAWYHGWRLPDVKRAGLNGAAEAWAVETLRYDSASQMVARTVTEDVLLHGTRLEPGARVAVLPAAANRDERVFPHPDVFDLGRDNSKVISFGRGPHHCLGAVLARLEMTIALEEIGALVSSYDVDLANARRVHSPHQRGFAALPCSVKHRPRA